MRGETCRTTFCILKTIGTKASTGKLGGQSDSLPGLSENDFFWEKGSQKQQLGSQELGGKLAGWAWAPETAQRHHHKDQTSFPAQSRANVVLAGEAGAGAWQGGGVTTGVTVCAAALHRGPDRLETGEGE